MRDAGAALRGGGRAEVHDPAAASGRDQPARQRPRAKKRRPEVQVEHPVPLRLVEIQRRGDRIDASDVGERVEAAERIPGLAHRALGLARCRQVGEHRDGLRFGGVLGNGGVAVDHRDRRPAGQQRLGQRAADAGGGAGDGDATALERIRHAGAPSPCRARNSSAACSIVRKTAPISRKPSIRRSSISMRWPRPMTNGWQV